MSHQGKVTTGIKVTSAEAHMETLVFLGKVYGGHIVEGVSEMKGYKGQKWAAKGTVLRGLKIGSYGTDVDFFVTDDGLLQLNGDSHGLSHIEAEYKRAYEHIVRKRALKKMGMKTKTHVNKETYEYVMVGEQ